jgi:hypothetical protein
VGYICEDTLQIQGTKELDFHYAQAAARTDVERAFGILKAQFAFVRGSTRF